MVTHGITLPHELQSGSPEAAIANSWLLLAQRALENSLDKVWI